MNSVLSSTKDNSIQNNNNKKKIFLNPKLSTQNQIIKNLKNNNNITNENTIRQSKKKQKIILPNNAIYEGYLINNEFDGYGEYKCQSYNYFGYFSCGKKSGKGKLEDFEKKLEYLGDFKDDFKEGYGEEKYQDGSVYIGQFEKNMKNGNGNLILGGGGPHYGYVGMFKNDKISGKGKFKWNDNKEYIGDWLDNEISGYGIFHEGKMLHIGFFKHNLKDGFGTTFYEEQNFALLGNWEKDLIEGSAILINLSENNSSDIPDMHNEIIVGMTKGEITNMNLEEFELNKFKKSKDYNELIKLYKEKFFVDDTKYTNEKDED